MVVFLYEYFNAMREIPSLLHDAVNPARLLHRKRPIEQNLTKQGSISVKRVHCRAPGYFLQAIAIGNNMV
jgi:hypothetical protein